MKYFAVLALAIASFAISKVILFLVSPNDPEGTNLLIVAVVAAIVFVPLALGAHVIAGRRRAK